jgi:hypothetical protein
MTTNENPNHDTSKAAPAERSGETPADTDDLWSTAGKNGRPPLPAQPDPNPDDVHAEYAGQATRKPGRPRGSRTRKPADNSDLTAIVYATKDRSECGGRIIDRQGGPDGRANLVVNNGTALISIPAVEEGKTWIYLHVAEEHRTRNLPINLSPATIRVLPGSPARATPRGAAGGTEPTDPAPCPPPAINPVPLPDDLLWLALESFAGDIETEIVARKPENIRHAASLILRLLRIAGV